MNCPECGKRNPGTLSNCAYCDHRLQQEKSGFGASFTSSAGSGGSSGGDSPSPFGQFSSGTGGKENLYGNPSGGYGKNTIVIDGPYNQIIGFGILLFLVFLGWFFWSGAYDDFMQSRGMVTNYKAEWCEFTGFSGQERAEARAAGFERSLSPGMSRRSSESRRECWAKELGTERPDESMFPSYISIETYYSKPPEGVTAPTL